MKTNKKGISLIVLIITILVMIIIAAAVILYLDDEKVIRNAERAVTENDIQVAKEILVVARAEWRTKQDQIKAEGFDTLQAYGEYKLEEAGFEIGYTQGKVAVLENGLLHTNKTPVIPKGYVASSVETEDEVDEGLVIYEGTEPVTAENVAVAQETRNQFVWVPVPDITDFVRKDWGLGSIDSYQSYNPNDAEQEAEYKAMKESVAKYGGFYIGRYEAETINDKLVVRKNIELSIIGYDWITAKERCKRLTNDSVESHLMYGEEWDAALTFISKTDPTFATVYDKEKGNFVIDYFNKKTGMSNNYKVNNIYDMAGNSSEWTSEYVGYLDYDSAHVYMHRGNSLTKQGEPPACRDSMPEYASDPDYGFRPALYLK